LIGVNRAKENEPSVRHQRTVDDDKQDGGGDPAEIGARGDSDRRRRVRFPKDERGQGRRDQQSDDASR